MDAMKERLYRATVPFAVVIAFAGCKSKSGSAAADGGAAAAATAGANPLAFLNGFEGEIDVAIKDLSKNRTAPEVVPITLQIKSDKVRAELPQQFGAKEVPKGHIVLNTPEKKLYVVMDDQKQIIVVDLNKVGDQFKSFGQGLPKGPKDSKSAEPSKPPPKITKTGVMDKVAGISCENWEVAEETHKVAQLCISDQSASWFHLPITGIPTEYAWTMELLDGKHFPLRMIGYDKKTGAEDGRVELTKFEKKTIAPTVFDMPAGYKTVDMAQMFGALAGAGAPGAAPFAGGLPPGVHLPAKKPK
jgi:Domain of unknown function (DUF4412)